MSDNKDTNDKKPNIFQKSVAAFDGWLNNQIVKGQNIVKKEVKEEEDLFYSKAVEEDTSYYVGAQGFKEKPYRLTFDHLKQIAYQDSIVSGIIQTRQNQVASHAKLAKSNHEKGFRIKLKNEESELDAIIQELRDGKLDLKDLEAPANKESVDKENYSDIDDNQDNEIDQTELDDSEEEEEVSEWEIQRKAKIILEEKVKKRKKRIEDFILNSGRTENRPFNSCKWNFESLLRALVRDSLTYDQLAIEKIRDNKGDLHHFVPVDGSTIRYSTPQLKKYKSFPSMTNYDLLYPEKQLEQMKENDTLELDEEKLEADEYKYVQIVRGKIERAFTADELALASRNPTTDIFNNGYSIPELELMISLISSHLNTEYYNEAYFSQGFSAKGILHIKAPLPKRKLQSIRQQWHHMIKGAKNSFQTPIFAGMDEVNWIPLTQNHSDIEFQGWLHYLIKMICSIYQIDPQEIGIGFKEEGGAGGGLSGDNTEEKLAHSKDKGLIPLLTFLANTINTHIISEIDADFELEFVGISEESQKQSLERQEKESGFKKTLNEIRAEDGLPPIPGADMLILNTVYMQWYGQKMMMEQQEQNPEQAGEQPPGEVSPEQADALENGESQKPAETPSAFDADEDIEKSLKIEYYKLGD